MGGRYRELMVAIIIANIIVFGGVVGYVVIEGWSIFDSFYMTIISLTTVGYGETHPLTLEGRIFTVILIMLGVGMILFVATRINETLIEGNIRRVMGRRKMDKNISRMKNHYIICGYGRLGQKIDSILKSRGLDTVVIEQSAETTSSMEDEGVKYILGLATDDEILRKAGILTAQGLIAGVNSDADNVYITLSAREMRPDIFILARTSDPAARAKMIRAGADKVISPIEIGARRMAQSILQPNVTDFLDLAVADDRQVQVQMEELPVGPKAELGGVKLMDSGIRANLNLIVVAIKKPDGQMIFNPGPEDTIDIGSTLIAIGPSDKLERLASVLDSSAALNRMTQYWEKFLD